MLLLLHACLVRFEGGIQSFFQLTWALLSALSAGCYSCLLDATLVCCMIVLPFLKVACGHLFSITLGFVSVLSVGCYSCLLDATLVCCMLVCVVSLMLLLPLGAPLVCCMLVLSCFKVAFGHLLFNNTGVLVCVVSWMLILSVGCYTVLHARLVILCCGLRQPFSQ